MPLKWALCFSGGIVGPLTKELTENMEYLARFMESHNEPSWASDIRVTIKKIASGSFSSVENMRSWWGTYGTLNDIIIRELNDGETFDSVNNKFSELQDNVYTLRELVIKNATFD